MNEMLLVNINQMDKDLFTKAWGNGIAGGQFSLQYASAKVGNEVYLFGGRVGLSANVPGRNVAYKYLRNVLTSVATMPLPLIAPCAAAVGRKIYLFGGCTQLTNGYENRKTYVYDVDLNTFTTETDIPVNCVAGACAAIGTDIYVYGGLINQSESGFPKLFYKYDTLAKTWTSLPYHDGVALYSTACVFMGDLLYAFGGEHSNALGNDVEVRVFDPATSTWSKPVVTGTKPGPRGAVAMVKYDESRFVVIGGRIGATASCSNEVWVFDITTLKWTPLPGYPSVISFHRAELIENKDIVVFDGYTWTGIYNMFNTLR